MMKRFKLSMIIGLLGLFGFMCFSNAGIISGGTYNQSLINVGKTLNFINSCRKCTTRCNNAIIYNADGTIYTNNVDVYSVYCSFNETGTIVNTSETETIPYNMMYIPKQGIENEFPKCQECEQCPEVNTGDILSGNCDTNYCVNNDLCPVYENSSLLFINEIEHQSAPVINITIPYEYTRDSSINSGQFDLTISGQNVDYEYIDGIIRTQKSSPNSTDFNNIITGLIPLFVPGLVIILFLWFVFKFIKKIF